MKSKDSSSRMNDFKTTDEERDLIFESFAKQIKDIRLHQNKGARGSTIQVNYGDGWEHIKIHIEE